MTPGEQRESRQHNTGDQIVEAFAHLDCVQELIPEGFGIHVRCVWDQRVDAPLPVGMMLTLRPLEDMPDDAIQL